MSVEIIHFRDADKLLKSQRMEKEVRLMLENLDQRLHSGESQKEAVKKALSEAGWREKLEALKILSDRRYSYKGFRNGVALEANFSFYEYLQPGLFRLQLGFDKGLLTQGILAITGQRSDKSKLGSSLELAKREVEELYPTISLPVTIAVFNLK